MWGGKIDSLCDLPPSWDSAGENAGAAGVGFRERARGLLGARVGPAVNHDAGG